MRGSHEGLGAGASCLRLVGLAHWIRLLDHLPDLEVGLGGRSLLSEEVARLGHGLHVRCLFPIHLAMCLMLVQVCKEQKIPTKAALAAHGLLCLLFLFQDAVIGEGGAICSVVKQLLARGAVLVASIGFTYFTAHVCHGTQTACSALVQFGTGLDHGLYSNLGAWVKNVFVVRPWVSNLWNVVDRGHGFEVSGLSLFLHFVSKQISRWLRYFLAFFGNLSAQARSGSSLLESSPTLL